MDKNEIAPQEEKKDKNRLTAIVSILAVAVLLIADLYVMVNMPGMILLLVGITAVLLAGVYVFVNAILKEINRSKEEVRQQYETIFKSEKASYILLKRAFEQLEQIESKSGEKHTSEDVITAQKAIAKVTISRNRENADALLNSNEKMLEKIFDFEEKLGSNQSELLDRQRNAIDDSMRELQESLKSEFAKAVNDLKELQLAAAAAAPASQPAVIPAPQPVAEEPVLTDAFTLPEEEGLSEEPLMEEIPLVEEDAFTDAFELSEEPLFTDAFTLPEEEELSEEPLFTDAFTLPEEEELSEEPLMEEIPLVEEDAFTDAFSLPEEPSLTEAFELPEEEGVSEEPSLTDAFELPEEEELPEEPLLSEETGEQLLEGLDTLDMGLGLDFGLDLGVDTGEEDALTETEPMIEPEAIIEPEPVSEPVIEPEPAPEPVIEPEPVPEPVIEPKTAPVPEPAPAEKPKPAAAPMPDLSDPHKMMTPDEIAALLANM